jgi:tetrahydromethanopterin S-methyltransferase subunit B
MKDKAENIITTELAKQNVTEAVIAKLKTDYLPLKINGIEDKAGYKKVHDARIVCRDHRTLTEKICKKGREDAVKIQKDWIAKEKEVVAQISEIEQYLKKQEDSIDAEKEAIKIRAEKLLKLPGRKEQVKGLDGFICNFDTMTDEIIMSYDDTQWQLTISDAQTRKLAKMQRDIDDANKTARLNRLTERTNILYAVAVSMRSTNGRKEFVKGDIHYSEDEIADMTQEQWDKICSEFKSAVIPELCIASSFSGAVAYSNALGKNMRDVVKGNKSEVSDEEKLFNYATSLEKVEWPGLKSKEATEIFNKAQEKLNEAIHILRK